MKKTTLNILIIVALFFVSNVYAKDFTVGNYANIYLAGAGLKNDYISYLLIGFALIICFISYRLLKNNDKEDKYVESVISSPPDNLTPAEVQFFHDGYSNEEGILSMLTFLANKGYIKIKEENATKDNNYNSFTITKIKDYDGTDKIEEMFLEGLFAGEIIEIEGAGLYHYVSIDEKQIFQIGSTTKIFNNKDGYKITLIKEYDNNLNNIKVIKKAIKEKEYKVVSKVNEVNGNILSYNFIYTVSKIEKEIDKKKELIYDENSVSIKKKHILIIIPLIISLIIYLFLNLGGLNTFIFVIALIGYMIPSIIISIVLLSIILSSLKFDEKKIKYITTGTFSIIFIAIMIFMKKNVVSADTKVYIVFTVGFFCTAISIICNLRMKKRTPFGINVLGKTNGLKIFIKTVEKEKLESLTKEDPTYFYKILPYTYALDQSYEWAEKFESIGITKPVWYESSRSFSVDSFNTFIFTLMNEITYLDSSDS